jgi:transcription initiation factor TFIID subunit 13
MTGNNLFTKELYSLMYAFGDVEQPRLDSVQLLDAIVERYICDYLQAAKRLNPAGKLRVEDLLYALKDDPKKLARVEELLYMNEELKKARKAFDVDED